MARARSHELEYRDHLVGLEVTDAGDLVLSLDGVERKRRESSGLECAYVWTNVELHWEEHHYLEARWWPATDRLALTVNGRPLFDEPGARE